MTIFLSNSRISWWNRSSYYSSRVGITFLTFCKSERLFINLRDFSFGGNLFEASLGCIVELYTDRLVLKRDGRDVHLCFVSQARGNTQLGHCHIRRRWGIFICFPCARSLGACAKYKKKGRSMTVDVCNSRLSILFTQVRLVKMKVLIDYRFPANLHPRTECASSNPPIPG